MTSWGAPGADEWRAADRERREQAAREAAAAEAAAAPEEQAAREAAAAGAAQQPAGDEPEAPTRRLSRAEILRVLLSRNSRPVVRPVRQGFWERSGLGYWARKINRELRQAFRPLRPPPGPYVPQSHRSEETRLNSSHTVNSYAVFCLKKKKKKSHHPH